MVIFKEFRKIPIPHLQHIFLVIISLRRVGNWLPTICCMANILVGNELPTLRLLKQLLLTLGGKMLM